MVLAILVRAAVFVIAWTAVTRTSSETAEPGQSRVGLGLLVFAVLAVAAAIWAGLDGTRGAPLAPLLVRWALVTLTLGIYVPVFTWLREPVHLPGSLASDLIVVSPLIAGVTFAPAAIAGAASTMAAANRRARRRSGPGRKNA